MTTLEDFENAPAGSIARKKVGLVAIREGDETAYLPWVCTTYGEWFSNEEMAKGGYTLVPAARSLPTREQIEQAVHDSADFLDWETCLEIADAVLALLKGQEA